MAAQKEEEHAQRKEKPVRRGGADGNILGPKLLGDSTGLASFWVLFSIILFGGLFGFAGMVLGVPVFAMLYSVVERLVRRGLRRRQLPEDTRSYLGKTPPCSRP